MSASRNSIVENMQMLCVKSGLMSAVGNMRILWVNGDFKVCCRKYAKVAILFLERGGKWILFGKGFGRRFEREERSTRTIFPYEFIYLKLQPIPLRFHIYECIQILPCWAGPVSGNSEKAQKTDFHGSRYNIKNYHM